LGNIHLPRPGIKQGVDTAFQKSESGPSSAFGVYYLLSIQSLGSPKDMHLLSNSPAIDGKHTLAARSNFVSFAESFSFL